MASICTIILNYRGASRTAACVNSLSGQPVDFVLVADNSADLEETAELRRALAGFGGAEFPVEVLVNADNQGFARGMNTALRWLELHRPHECYVLLNNDAEAMPGMIDTLASHLKDHSEIGLVAPRIETASGVSDGFWYHRPTGLLFAKPTLSCFHYLSGCCLMVRRELVVDGLFDEDFFMYGEDVELGWRLGLKGVGFATVAQARLRHEGTGSSRHGGWFYEYHVTRGHKLLARKMAAASWEVPLFMTGRAVVLSLRAVLRCLRFRTLAPLRALLMP
jgi:N-acetylglucosaminyl-diphospho-decaprenol L-rhamnosyltransferase